MPKFSKGQQTAAIMVVVVLLAALGVWLSWPKGDPVPVSESVAPSQEVEAVGPGVVAPSSTADSVSVTPSPTGEAVGMSQEESAKIALERLVPLWATMEMPAEGPDVAVWMKTWRDDPAAGSGFIDMSRDNYVGLVKGLAGLGASGKVDAIESANMDWKQGNLSGWIVTMHRQITSPTGVNESEALMWEFLVEQRPDGTSQINSFSAVAATHDGTDPGHGH